MDQRISFITLAVADLDASRRFYLEGLGWKPTLDVPGEVIMIKVGDRLVLSLWDRAAFEAEIGEPAGTGVPPITLAHNTPSPKVVDEVLDLARSLGATVIPGQDRDWGGYTGYMIDPDASVGRSPGTPDRSGRSCCPEYSLPRVGVQPLDRRPQRRDLSLSSVTSAT